MPTNGTNYQLISPTRHSITLSNRVQNSIYFRNRALFGNGGWKLLSVANKRFKNRPLVVLGLPGFVDSAHLRLDGNWACAGTPKCRRVDRFHHLFGKFQRRDSLAAVWKQSGTMRAKVDWRVTETTWTRTIIIKLLIINAIYWFACIRKISKSSPGIKIKKIVLLSFDIWIGRAR